MPCNRVDFISWREYEHVAARTKVTANIKAAREAFGRTTKRNLLFIRYVKCDLAAYLYAMPKVVGN